MPSSPDVVRAWEMESVASECAAEISGGSGISYNGVHPGWGRIIYMNSFFVTFILISFFEVVTIMVSDKL